MLDHVPAMVYSYMARGGRCNLRPCLRHGQWPIARSCLSPPSLNSSPSTQASAEPYHSENLRTLEEPTLKLILKLTLKLRLG